MPQVMVISAEGYFYLYNIDLDNGGECALTKQYRQASVVLLVFSPTYSISVCWTLPKKPQMTNGFSLRPICYDLVLLQPLRSC